jgi:hypothetical protein
VRVYITQPRVRWHECLYKGATGTLKEGWLVLDCSHVFDANVCKSYGIINEEPNVRRPRAAEVR